MKICKACHIENRKQGQYNSVNWDPACVTFEVIFSKYYNALIRFAVGFKIQSELAEELVGDAMVKLWQRFEKFEHPLQMKTFLYTTVRFACLNVIRNCKRKPVIAIDNLLDPCSPDDNVSQSLVKTEIWKEVRHGITNLPPQCKSVVESLFFLQLNSKQIAGELNVAVSTVRNQKARGLKLLRSRIKL